MVISICWSGAIPADTAYLCVLGRKDSHRGRYEGGGGEERWRSGTKALKVKKPLKKNCINIYTTYNAPSLWRKEVEPLLLSSAKSLFKQQHWHLILGSFWSFCKVGCEIELTLFSLIRNVGTCVENHYMNRWLTVVVPGE